jgi:cytochrome c oxidase assembly protein subunit 11
MRVHPGEIMHTTYTVKNTSSEVFVGQAVPSVTPAVAAPYLQKIECFCFSQQTFQPGEVRTMPVVFVIKPDMSRDLGTVTLSYTFFEAPKARI